MHLLAEGWSQAEVGRRLGISQSRVSQISRNRR
ncbi:MULTISPECIES: sigma factor-like helix-turn-helix DNA-binding protein [Betaproteobacteria]